MEVTGQRKEGMDTGTKDEYAKLQEDAKALSKELEQRLEYQRFVDIDKPQAERKFERETRGIGIHKICRALLYKATNDSDFKEDVGKVQEFTRESEISGSGVREKTPGSFALPQKSFAPVRTFKRALTTAGASGGEAIQDYTETPTLATLYSRTVLAKIGAEVRELPSGQGSYKVIKMVDSSTNRSSAKAEGADLGCPGCDHCRRIRAVT